MHLQRIMTGLRLETIRNLYSGKIALSYLQPGADDVHVNGLVWRMGHGVPVSSYAEQVREVFSLPVICATRAAACAFNLGS